jgi:hypothetical protein
LALLLSACAVVTEPCAASVDLSGSWRYSAVQQAPTHSTLSGTLLITEQNCVEFAGQLDLIEVNAQGGSRRVTGPVAGRVIDASSVRFDAFLEAVPRQHLAILLGDSVSGTWLAVDGTGQTVSGTFGGHRGLSP